MKESLIDSHALKFKLRNSIVGNGNSQTEFTDLVLGFSEKVQRMASNLTLLSVEKSKHQNMKSCIRVMR